MQTPIIHSWDKRQHAGSDTQQLLKNYTGQEQEDVQEEEEPAPGSASAEPRRKRTLNDAPAEEEEGEEKPPARLGEFIEPPTGADEVKKE